MSTPHPPYAQIAAALRDQINSGELAPGDRVPSTRELTRQWGVAMATATKALTTLRQEGLVRPVAGVGTVVDDVRRRGGPAAAAVVPRPRARNPIDGALTIDRIVTAAIDIADAEGLAALSMRRVAIEVGVATMSLYRHVADKDALVLSMMDTVLREWQPPAVPPESWRPALELAARTLWSTFRRHPWLAPALSITRPQPVPGGMAYTEYVLSVLDQQRHDQPGLDLPSMFNAHITLFNYVRGTALNLESEAQAEASSGLNNDEWMDAQQGALRSILDGGAFPLLTQITDATFDFDLDVLFETGLRYLLDGLAGALVHRPGLPASE